MILRGLHRQIMSVVWLSVLVSGSALAEVPEQCVQAPQRTTMCPHMLFRIAKAPVPGLNIPKNGMVCLCLSDLTDLPVVDQPEAFEAMATHLQMPVTDLFVLLEIPVPDWAKQ